MNKIRGKRKILIDYGIIVWVINAFFLGAHFRYRTIAETQEIDWLVIVQIIIAIMSIILGFFMIKSILKIGFGSKLLLIYNIGILCSAVAGNYVKMSLGYFLIFFGFSMSTIGLISQASEVNKINKIENAAIFVIIIIIFNDILRIFLSSTFSLFAISDQNFRMGAEIVAPNSLGILSAILLSIIILKNKIFKNRLVKAMAIVVLIIILLGTRSRSALICLFIGIFFYFWRHQRLAFNKMNIYRTFLIFVLISMGASGMFLLQLDYPIFKDLLNTINRGLDKDELMSLTGRIEIWDFSLERSFNNIHSIIFGHGYGVSRFTFYDAFEIGRVVEFGSTGQPNWIYTHAHNAFIECLYSTGLIGFVPFMLMYLSIIRWINILKKNQNKEQVDFVYRAISIATIMWFTSLTESYTAIKINIISIIFYLYLIMADKSILFLSPTEEKNNGR